MGALIVVLVCIALNALLAGLEVAFIAASKARVKAHSRPGDAAAARFLRLRESPERALSAIQVGITLVSIVSGAVGGAGAQDVLTPVLMSRAGLGASTAQVVAIAVVAVPLMMATVVIGELVPKMLALRHPEHLALAGARWLHLLEVAFHPLVLLLAWITRTLVRFIPRERFTSGPQAAARGPYALDLVDLARRRVRDAMVPWAETITADPSMPPKGVTDLALASGHTRLPVLDGDGIAGILHTKELLAFVAAGERDWRALLRPPVTVSPDDALLGVLRLLQVRRSHMAIVLDGDRHPVGMVTLEDILEEVLGDLYDEDDDRAVQRLLASRRRREIFDATGKSHAASP